TKTLQSVPYEVATWPDSSGISRRDIREIESLVALQPQRVCHATLPWLISFSLDLMRRLAILLAIETATLAMASDPIRVDGVRVYGMVHEVSTGDIRAAIADFVSTSSDKNKP